MIKSKFSKSRLICCLVIVLSLVFVSCNNEARKAEEVNDKVKKAVSSYLNDEFFKRNYSTEIIEMRVNKITYMAMDSLLKDRMRDIVYSKINQLNKQFPNHDDIPNFVELSTTEATSQPKFLKLKRIASEYTPEQKGMYVYIYAKMIYKNSQKSQNYLFEDKVFLLDNNFKVLDSDFGFGDNK